MVFLANSIADYVDNLNKELDMFRKIFNRRVIYFAALQEISDSVCLNDRLRRHFREPKADLPGNAA